MGPRFESVKVHQWPVGQVVKTEASHAFNIGSNPVRVTNNKKKLLTQSTECAKIQKLLDEESFDIQRWGKPIHISWY